MQNIIKLGLIASAFVATAAFADCSVNVNYNTSDDLSRARIEKKLKTVLGAKNYTISDQSGASYALQVTGGNATGENPFLVFVSASLSDRNTGKTIASGLGEEQMSLWDIPLVWKNPTAWALGRALTQSLIEFDQNLKPCPGSR